MEIEKAIKLDMDFRNSVELLIGGYLTRSEEKNMDKVLSLLEEIISDYSKLK